MKIYILECDTDEYWGEARVFTDIKEATQTLKKEYEDAKDICGILDPDVDEDGYTYSCDVGKDGGEATIDSDYGDDYWHWRLTRHEIKTSEVM
jgi:hypothetical protein